MREYFLHNGQDQIGPLTLEELRKRGINSKSMIWYKGIPSWIEASEIDELKEILDDTPPPYSRNRDTPPPLQKAKVVFEKDYINEVEKKIPSSTGKKFFKLGLLLLAIVGLFVVIGKLFPSKENLEKKTPLEYLELSKASGSIYRSYYESDGDVVITGEIINKSQYTRYKDFVIEVQYLSKTKTLIATTDYVLYDQVEPGRTAYIKTQLKEKAPDGAYELTWKLLDATGLTSEQ